MNKEVQSIKFGLIAVLVGFIGLPLFFGSYTVVNPGQRGIRVTMGSASNETLGEGLHFKLPLFSSIKKVSIQVQKTEATSEAATKDLQKVHATFALNWSLNPDNVVDIFRNIGNEKDIAERIIQPAVSEVLKAATAHMTAEEVLTKRLELKLMIDEMLQKRLNTYTIVVRDVSLVDLDFTKEFNRAVEEKQIAEQEAKKAEYVAIQATNDAKARVNKAKGEAEAQRLLQQSITPMLLQLKAIEKWSGDMPQVLGSGGNMLFNIPTQSKKAE